MQPLRYRALATTRDIPVKLLLQFPRVGREGGSRFAWAPALGVPGLGRRDGRRDGQRGSARSGTAWPVLPVCLRGGPGVPGTTVVWSIPRAAYWWHFRYSRVRTARGTGTGELVSSTAR